MNKWFKTAAISFVGILIASFALGLTNTMGGTASAMGGAGQNAQAAHNHAGGSGSQDPSQGQNYIGAQAPGMTPSAPVTYGQVDNNIQAQIYWMQVNLMQMQQQLNQMSQIQMGNPGFMGNGAGMSNMGGANNMGSMNSTGNSGMGSNGSGNNMGGSGASGGSGMGMM